ncbi:MAG: hypothetical protein EU539_13800 [Promethearchaeota archaeon]|nr:MAG: hypothetical protein EU539_13800 [Candidatus Lokiarchaeota archaeon]
MNKSSFDHVLLLGDAAGQVKATTGGGIIMLLIAAKYAAYCIKKCFLYGRFSQKFIKKHYESNCLAMIGKQLKIHYMMRKLFETLTDEDYQEIFHVIKKTDVGKVISLHGDMDFPRELILQLLKNKGFIKFLLKYWIKHPLTLFNII